MPSTSPLRSVRSMPAQRARRESADDELGVVALLDARRAGKDAVERAADDQLDQVGLGQALRVDRVDLAAVAEHRDPVGDRQHLVEPVAHVQDGLPGRGVAAQRLEKCSTSAAGSEAVGSSSTRTPRVASSCPAGRARWRPAPGRRRAARRAVSSASPGSATWRAARPCARAAPASRSRPPAPRGKPGRGRGSRRRSARGTPPAAGARTAGPPHVRRAGVQSVTPADDVADDDLAARVGGHDAGQDLDERRLPEPLPPSRAWTSPGRICMNRESSARVPA